MTQVPFAAPTFSLVGDDDTRYELTNYVGQWVIVYFYPKDDTPGCTVQACSIRDSYGMFDELGVKVFGISMDTPQKHRSFKQKYNLPFTLLSDPMGKTIREYDAWGKKMFGREGILRKTFIIDPNGIVQKVYGRAIPTGHGEKVVSDLKDLMKSA